MANFNGTILTNLGKQVIAQSLTGKQFEITKVVLGDGVWDENTNPEELTSLISPKLTLPIADKEENGDTVRIRVLLTNEGVTEGFFIRELGVIAEDKTTGEEILYAVAYADLPDYLPAGDGPTKVEAGFDVIVVVANSPNITVRVSDTIVLATKQDIEQHNTSADAHPDIRQAIQDATENLSQEIDAKVEAHNLDTNAHPDIRQLLEDFKSQFEGDFSESGYYKLPNGLIIQWGIAEIHNNPDDPQQATEIPLPISFPNRGFQVVASDVGWGRHSIGISFKDNSTLLAWSYDPVNQQYADVTGFRWIAIGY